MKYLDRKNKDRDMSSVVVTRGRAGWVAGIRWTQSAKGNWLIARMRMKSTHYLNCGTAVERVTGLVSPGAGGHAKKYYSLAAAFLHGIGGSSYGIYRIDETRWVFLATVNGRMTVMGDVVGTLNDVKLAESRFLSFNDPGTAEWNCVARAEDEVNCLELITAFPSRKYSLVRLRKVSLVLPAIFASALIAVAATGLWLKAERDREASDEAFRAAMNSKPVAVKAPDLPSLPHPWASQVPLQHLLSQCWSIRSPGYVSVAGWRYSGGTCNQRNLRLHYVATPGSTISAFDRRVTELFGRPASFNLKEGGKDGDVIIPLDYPDSVLRDESLDSVDEQLKRFISYLQLRNVPVQFSEVVASEAAPGARKEILPQDWREFTFTITSRLAAEWLLAGIDDKGIRVTEIAINKNAKEFNYIIRGSIYAKK